MAAPELCPPPEPGQDDAQETDLWWGAPSTRDMLPNFVISILTTAVIGAGAWYLYKLEPEGAYRWRYAAYALFLILWGYQLFVWVYRAAFVTYRLTTCRLLRDSGIRRPTGQVLLLARVRRVCVEQQTWRERWLGTGRVTVSADGHPPLTIVLHGLYQPRQVAASISDAIQRAKQYVAAEML